MSSMILEKKLSALFILFFFFSLPVNGMGGEFCDEPISQLKEFASFYPDDEKIQENLPLIENLCLNEEKKFRDIEVIFLYANVPKNVKNFMREKSLELFRHDTFFLQQIFQYQIETGKSFDLNFFQNMMSRSGLTAIRLAKDRFGMKKEVYQSLDELLPQMKEHLSKKIPSDQQLVSPETIAGKRGMNTTILNRLKNDDLLLVKVERPEEFNDFFEVVCVLYSERFLKEQGFFDYYDFMQYLLTLEYQGVQLNKKYYNAPFNVSKFAAVLSKPTVEKPITLPARGWFIPKEEKVDFTKVEPVEFFAKRSRVRFTKEQLPERFWTIYQFLRKKQVLGKKNSRYAEVSQQVYENRLFVLANMDDEDFFQRYRSVKNNQLFYDYAKTRLSIQEFKQLMSESYRLPGGNFTLPRYRLLGYTDKSFQKETSFEAIYRRIPDTVQTDFIFLTVKTIFSRLSRKEIKSLSRGSRIQEIGELFGSQPGAVGDEYTYRTFYDLYLKDLEEAGRVLGREAGISALEGFKWLTILSSIESRGNIFALSQTGALGPFQHTMSFYYNMKPMTIPFHPKAAAIKTAKEFGRYYRKYGSFAKAVSCYHDGEGIVRKAIKKGGRNWRQHISKPADRYINNFSKYLRAVDKAKDSRDVVNLLAEHIF